MGYSQSKGSTGEREMADFLTRAMPGYGFIRIGGVEANKKILFGDVMVDPKTDPDKKCVLRDKFLESKKMAKPNPFATLEEAEDHAVKAGKSGSICYIVRQGSGHKRDGAMIVMSPLTFSLLIGELQGYIDGEGKLECGECGEKYKKGEDARVDAGLKCSRCAYRYGD
jgi:hypothetical protein